MFTNVNTLGDLFYHKQHKGINQKESKERNQMEHYLKKHNEHEWGNKKEQIGRKKNNKDHFER